MNKKYTLVLLALALTLFLIPSAMATITFTGTPFPTVQFAEGGSNNSIDLDDGTYLDLTNMNGTSLTIDFIIPVTSDIIADYNAGNGVITFDTSNTDYVTNGDTIDINISDANSTIMSSISVMITAVNDIPSLADLPEDFALFEDETFTYDASLNASDVDLANEGDTLTITADAGDWEEFNMNVDGLINFMPTSDSFGVHNVLFRVTDEANATATKNVEFIVTESCDDGGLELNSFSWDDITGEDDELWPGDEIELEFDIENTLSNDDIDNIKVRAWVEDENGDRITDRESLDKFDLNDGDSEDNLNIVLKIDPEADEGDYYLVIHAEGEDSDDDNRCEYYFKELSVERPTHGLLIDSVSLNTETPQCGQDVEVSTKIYNVGNKDEDVRLRIKNSLLDINILSEEFELKDSGSKADILKQMVVAIPNMATGSYWLEVEATFDDGDEETSSSVQLEITCPEGAGDDSGSDSGATGEATVSFDKTSTTGVAGQRAKFTMTLTNSGDESAVFKTEVSVNWAQVNIEPVSTEVGAGESIPISVYLKPNTDVSGDKTATVTVKSNNEVLKTQTLTMDVLESGSKVSGATITDLTANGKSVDLGDAFEGELVKPLGVLLVAMLLLLVMVMYAKKKQARPQVEVIMPQKRTKKRR